MGEATLLPPGKFARFSIAAALAAALLLFVNSQFAPVPERSLLYANFLDLSMVVLAALSSFHVARRSSGPSRRLWTLLTIAFVLLSLAQAISTYYQSFVPGSEQIPWPSDLLFFIWVTPVFMMFFPLSGDKSSRLDWLYLLDFAQVGIVASTAYLYFFYAPSRWKLEGITLVHEMLLLYVIRDLLLSLGFFFRGRTIASQGLRRFSSTLCLVFLAAAIGDGAYLLTLRDLSASANASFADVLWALPALLVILLGATWNYNIAEPVRRSPSALGNYVVSHVLPIGIPLLVIFLGRAVAREQFLLSWLAVTASFLCSALRLILTNRRQLRTAEELLAAEKNLRQTELMFSSIFRASPDGFSISVFPGGSYLDVNDGFTRLTGYTREEALSRTPSELDLWVNPYERGEVFSQLSEKGEVRDFEFRFRTKSGEIRTGQLSASLLDVNGRRCSVVAVRDITVRKEAENLLRSSEERFRSLVENLHVGIVIYDPQVRVLFANQAIQNAFGRKYDQFLGKTTDELGLITLHEDGSVMPPEARPVPIVLATGQPVRGQLIGVRAQTSPDIVWTLSDAIPEFSDTGEISRVILSVTNLTEQRRALDALRESEERFRTLVRDLHVGVVLQDADRTIQFVNRAALEIFGFTEQEVLGKKPNELPIHPIDEEGNDIPFSELPGAVVFRTHEPFPHHVMGMRNLGSRGTVWLYGNAVPQFASDGSILRVIASYADITEMKNAERAIQQLSAQLLRLQDEERRRIGRELHDGLAQNVLAINLSLAQARQSMEPMNPGAANALEKARGLLQQMSREIRTLSYLLHPPLLDDLGLISALKEYSRGFGERSGVNTQIVLLSDFERLSQEIETALFRVVQESLANIKRHSGSKTAHIRLRQDSGTVFLEVADSGRGMKLQPNGNARQQDSPLGVGIPGMRERVALLGGRLDIDSGPAGTTIRATIPLLRRVPTGDQS